MFDTHVHRAAPNYPQRIHTEITEQRAPTDDSVRLLREMEDKARDSVLFAIRCDANPFKFRAMVYDDWNRFQKFAHINFWLGEQKYDFEVEVPKHCISQEECAAAVKEAIAKKLAEILTINLYREHFINLA